MKITDIGAGPPIILLHGWGQTSEAFEPLAQALTRSHRVITFDLPGHGQARGEAGPYTFARYAKSLGKVIETLGLTRFSLLGWSMGGGVAVTYIANGVGPLPESLILLCSSPRFIAPDKNFLTGQHPARVKKMERMIKADHGAGLREFITSFFESGEKIPVQKKAEIEKLLLGYDFPPDKEALLQTLAELSTIDLTASRIEYGAVVKLIYGGLDKITPPGGQRLWRNVFAKTDETSIDNAGHAPHLTRVEEVAGSITDFLKNQE